MKLKPTISIIEFLKAIQKCQGDVLFTTADGDTLNLKSQLAKYVFLAMLSSEDLSLISIGEVFCDNPRDQETLSVYFLSDTMA